MSPASPEFGNRRGRYRSRLLRYVVCVVVIGSSICFYFFWIRPVQQMFFWHREVEYRLLTLAEKCPNGLKATRWAFCIHWTWNLHCNCGAHYFSATEREQFLTELDERLAREVDLGTIDWIWDQYCRYSTCGQHYSQNYRATTAERLKDGAADLQEWIEMLRRRRLKDHR